MQALDNDTAQREAELEAKAWEEIEEAGHNRLAVEDYRDNMGEHYCPLYGAGVDGEAVMLWEDWIGDFEEAFTGYDDAEAFAIDLADEFMLVGAPDTLVRYFDYKLWERDLFMGDYFEGSNGYIFRSL